MTLRKKLLILIACLSVVLCTLVTGTIAWLTDKTDSIKNEFTPSDISITLTESENLDLKMVPGKAITKDPKVTVKANSEPCWVFVKIEESTNFDTFMTYAIADGWTQLTGVDGVYYRKVDAADADQEFSVLAGDVVNVNETVTKADMNALTAENYPTLTFTAYAIQQEGFATADDAWNEISNSFASNETEPNE